MQGGIFELKIPESKTRIQSSSIRKPNFYFFCSFHLFQSSKYFFFVFFVTNYSFVKKNFDKKQIQKKKANKISQRKIKLWE